MTTRPDDKTPIGQADPFQNGYFRPGHGDQVYYKVDGREIAAGSREQAEIMKDLSMRPQKSAASLTPAPTIVIDGRALSCEPGFKPLITHGDASDGVGRAMRQCDELGRRLPVALSPSGHGQPEVPKATTPRSAFHQLQELSEQLKGKDNGKIAAKPTTAAAKPPLPGVTVVR